MTGATRSPDRRTGSAGFTLLEVLVALAILSVAVVAAIQGFAQGLRLLKLAGDHQEAMLIADRKTREIVVPDEGHDEGTEGRFHWERTTRRLEAPDLAPLGSPPRFRVYEIDVRVRWEGERQVEVATLRTTPVTTEATVPAGTLRRR
jgi:general secretion pathway protein I